MPIHGTIISRAGQRTSREDGAALRQARRAEAMQHEGARQALYRLQHATGNVQAVGGEVARLKRELVDLETELGKAEAAMRTTGKRPDNLTALRVTIADFPAMIAAAEDRVKAAQAALDAARAAFDAINGAPAEIAEEAPRVRGRPPKVA